MAANTRGDGYRYALAIFDDQGRTLGQTPVATEFETAIESVRFLGIRQGRVPPTGEMPVSEIAPVWNGELGEPYASGFRVKLGEDGNGQVSQEFGPVFFHDEAERASSRLVEQGKLKPGDKFHYSLTAFRSGVAKGNDGDGFPEEPACRATPLVLHEGRLVDRLDAAERHGAADDRDFPVFVPQRVLCEASDLARTAGGKETGGVLVGHLYRDDSVPEVFAVVNAQIPASRARPEVASLTFTPETWAEIDSIVALRGKGELYLGWWHSHPTFAWSCRNCPVERRRRCPLANDFLSAEDRGLHRTVFPRAYSVALVVNVITPEEHTYSLFGWREGRIGTRGFFVVPEPGARDTDNHGPRAA
jgi:hypothetical protein